MTFAIRCGGLRGSRFVWVIEYCSACANETDVECLMLAHDSDPQLLDALAERHRDSGCTYFYPATKEVVE